ncbi:MAG TPA: hypothetical protein VM819_17175 [Vicinamibacterales bacterium]|nr:hypothetical protein [Vicinamibacterales bacterium]
MPLVPVVPVPIVVAASLRCLVAYMTPGRPVNSVRHRVMVFL